MTPARPYTPRPGERSSPEQRFPHSRRRQLQIWWSELDRPLLFLVLALMAVGAVSVAAASPVESRRALAGEAAATEIAPMVISPSTRNSSVRSSSRHQICSWRLRLRGNCCAGALRSPGRGI